MSRAIRGALVTALAKRTIPRSYGRLAAFAGIVTALIVAFPGIAHAALDADWEMNETGSPPPTMVDSSGGGHDGQPTGGTVGDGSTYTFDGTGVVIVHDADALFAELRARGVEFTRGLADTPWNSREFVVKDSDGRLLAFGANSTQSRPEASP